MSVKDRRNATRRLEGLFNLSRPGHGENANPELAATNGYPTKATDFEGQGWRRWINGSYRISGLRAGKHLVKTTGPAGFLGQGKILEAGEIRGKLVVEKSESP